MSKFDNYTEEELFEYNIWELEIRINAAYAHIEDYKEKNKHFSKPEKRVKGSDTQFYELNLPDWERQFEISLNQFEKDYGRKYDKGRVRHTR